MAKQNKTDVVINEKSHPTRRGDNTPLSIPQAVIDAITDMLVAERRGKEMREVLRQLMEARGVVEWSCNSFTASFGRPTSVTSFDSQRFAVDHPKLYDQYKKVTMRKPAFTVKLV